MAGCRRSRRAASGARVLSAAAIDSATVEALFGDRIENFRSARFDLRGARRSLQPEDVASAPFNSPARPTASLINKRSREACWMPSADTASPSCHGANMALHCASVPPSPARMTAAFQTLAILLCSSVSTSGWHLCLPVAVISTFRLPNSTGRRRPARLRSAAQGRSPFPDPFCLTGRLYPPD